MVKMAEHILFIVEKTSFTLVTVLQPHKEATTTDFPKVVKLPLCGQSRMAVEYWHAEAGFMECRRSRTAYQVDKPKIVDDYCSQSSRVMDRDGTIISSCPTRAIPPEAYIRHHA